MQIYRQWNGLEFNKQYDKLMSWQFENYEDFMEILSDADNRIVFLDTAIGVVGALTVYVFFKLFLDQGTNVT